MTATTTLFFFGPDYAKELLPWLLSIFGEATAHAYKIIWDAGLQIVLQHLVFVAFILLLILGLSALRAFVVGRWGWFASVLYHYFYGGALLVIGFIWGPEVFANDYFEIVLVILYITCFSLTGVVLKKTGLMRSI